MRYITSICVIAASLALSACGNKTATSSTAGINSIKLQGGAANLSGGLGGSITIDSFSDVKIKTDGAVVTNFTVPPLLSPVFGVVHHTVTGSPQVFVGNAPAHPNGSLFVNLGDLNLHRANDLAPGGSDIVTGLTVSAGATLSLPVNDVALNATELIFANSVVIDGTLKTEVSGTNLYLEAGNAGSASAGNQSLLQVSSTGSVTTAGTTGGAAGGNLFLFSWGGLINQGVTQGGNQRGLDASGLAGSGGNAGFIELESFGFLYNTGTVTARGGSAAAGPGGNGNRIGMTAFNGSLNTNGALDNSGGDGSGNGGAGGAVYLLGGINDASRPNPFGFANISTATGRVLIGGTLTSNGGQSQNGIGGSAAGNNNGPTAPGIFLESGESGGLLVNAKITARGGATTAGSSGGSGGTLTLNQHFGAARASGSNPAPIEGIKLGSIIDLTGGAGVTAGGAGGGIIIGNDFSPDALPSSSPTNTSAGLPIVELDGYTGINLSGGNGNTGGNAGAVQILTASPTLASLVFPAPAISNAVAITATGGAGGTGATTGGLGGSLDWRVGGRPLPPGAVNAFQEQISVLESKGAINISGGDGSTGGTGGHLFFHGYTVKSTGIVTARGGKGIAGGSATGLAFPLEMHADLNLSNSASITATGGGGVTGGDGAALITLTAGNKVTNTGSISANGGAGTTDNGGSGGLINLQSGFQATSNTGPLNVAKGAGTPDGVPGRVIIDFIEKTVPSSGTVT